MADVSFETTLKEAYRKATGGYEVILIEAGQYNGRLYSAHVLERAASLFEGVQAFCDRPTPKERRERPERSIRDLIGFYEGVHARNRALKATLRLIDGTEWLEEIIEKASEVIGVRVNADGKTRRDWSKDIDVVESIDSVFSADIVTGTARTGKISESRKEMVRMSEYRIGTLLPEAKKAWLELNLKEGAQIGLYVESEDGKLSVRQVGEKGKPYRIGTLLPEARQAWAKLNLREGK